ncbi:MAG: succinylglutamate desuccinylase/aspartoacylase family protein [Gemmatimonadetes bacterium]|nr:succinylglutamate desuccinylase/aspartoacylase family protein [Gemmatimonadota bacterium]
MSRAVSAPATPGPDEHGHQSERPGNRSGLESDRIIGRYGTSPGPHLICLGGLHGNEPAGVLALRRVLATLNDTKPTFHGQIVAIAGNLRALKAGRRFLQRDLNRGWSPRGMRRVEKSLGAPAEDGEQAELIAVLRKELEGDRSQVRVIDLHTASAEGPPFLTFADTIRNREFARRIGLPLVLGIEEQIDGALLEVITAAGPITLGIEAGQHDDPASVDHHERAVWMALIAAGHIAAADVPDLDSMRDALSAARRDLPMIFEVRYRKPVGENDGFSMRPGYRNFQRISAGEEVGRDRHGPVTAPEDGRIFLPLYQEQGDDGFFVVRDVHPVWLHLSAVLRRLRISSLARWLPGIHAARRRADVLIVDRRIARWLAVDVFHLLGYRKSHVSRGWYVFRRRSHDRKVQS